MQPSSVVISEEIGRVEELLSRAAGIIAGAKGSIKIRQAMNLVGFTKAEICSMTLYQRVRRQSMRLSVVDTRVVNTMKAIVLPVMQVNVGSGDTVTSTLSSAERTGEITATQLQLLLQLQLQLQLQEAGCQLHLDVW